MISHCFTDAGCVVGPLGGTTSTVSLSVMSQVIWIWMIGSNGMNIYVSQKLVGKRGSGLLSCTYIVVLLYYISFDSTVLIFNLIIMVENICSNSG
jgi:hypothetical protein